MRGPSALWVLLTLVSFWLPMKMPKNGYGEGKVGLPHVLILSLNCCQRLGRMRQSTGLVGGSSECRGHLVMHAGPRGRHVSVRKGTQT